MEGLSQSLASALGLSFVPAIADYIIVLGMFVLVFLTSLNLLGGKEEETQSPDSDSRPIIDKEEAPSEKIEAHEEVKVEEKPAKPVVSWEKRLFKGLSKTRSEIWGKIGSIISGKSLSEDIVEELEEILFTSDLSPQLVDELLEELKNISAEENHLDHIKSFMKSKMVSAQDKVNTELYKFDKPSDGPKVIMIVGVNGAGKTTTIGKLATKLKDQGAKVVVGACDTFRAAAVEQLEVWCNRANVEIVKAAEGADPSGVAYDAVAKAKEIGADYCIIDTAGRLHTKSNLMDELKKTKTVMSKVLPDAPHETLLVVDAITGQNALRQAEEFNRSLELTGLIFTKCDGSSKAGSAVSIVQTLSVPIVYIGVGEDVEDLDIFNLDNFLDALLGIPSAVPSSLT